MPLAIRLKFYAGGDVIYSLPFFFHTVHDKVLFIS